MRTIKPGAILLSLVLVTAILLTACSSPAPSSTPTPTQPTTSVPTSIAPTTTPGTTSPAGPYGNLRIGVASLVQEKLDPVPSSGTNIFTLLVPLYDFFFMVDDNVKVVPGVIESWEVAPDGLSTTWRVTKGIKFHNGEDLTADDVKFSIDRYMTDPTRMYNYVLDCVSRTEVLDQYTVRIYTKGTQPFFIPQCAQYPGRQSMVMPKDYIEQNGVAYFDKNPVGSGPFKFARHVPGDMVEYQALDKHWRQTAGFKNLAVILMPEESTRIAALKTGQLDTVEIDLESSQELEAAGFTIAQTGESYAAVQFRGALDPRNAGKPTADVRVRKALQMAINAEEIRKSFFFGKAAEPMPIPMSIKAADIDGAYWLEYGKDFRQYNPDEAKKLLAEAGYPNGFTIKLYSFILGGSPWVHKFAEVIQGYWMNIGVKTELYPMDSGAFRTLNTGGPDKAPANELVGQAAIMANSWNPILPNQLQSVWTSGQAWGTTGSTSIKSIPGLDELIAASWGENDAKKRSEVLAKAIKLAADSHLAIMVGGVPGLYGISPKIDIRLPKPALESIVFYAEKMKHKK